MANTFDSAVIEQLQALMGDDFALLVDTFVSDSNKRLALIYEAVAKHDAELLRTTAHGLKGSALNLSAKVLSELASELEAMGKANALAEAKNYADALTAELERVCSELTQTVN